MAHDEDEPGTRHRALTRAVAVALAAVVVGAVVVGAAVWLAPPGDHPPARHVAGPASPGGTTPAPSCAQVAHAFVPTEITVAGVTTRARVVAPPPAADGTPGTPPLTSAGKTMFAWDRQQGIRPGDAAGHVLLNAHTWPDGSALGNRLLAGLHRGDRIVVRGASTRLCYRVIERVQVLATHGLARYYATDGPPRLAIVVCSGRRLGPGVWEKRTVWFAAPSA
jgi:hypothetical protein